MVCTCSRILSSFRDHHTCVKVSMENLPLKDTEKTHTQAMVSILITVVEGVKLKQLISS